jgi:outer membrane biosynthesis protein TonB
MQRVLLTVFCSIPLSLASSASFCRAQDLSTITQRLATKLHETHKQAMFPRVVVNSFSTPPGGISQLTEKLITQFSEKLPSQLAPDPVKSRSELIARMNQYLPNPACTEQARREKYQGKIVVKSIVDESGRVTPLHVTETGPPDLVEESLAVFRTWELEPVKKEGSPVAVCIAIESTFRLF